MIDSITCVQGPRLRHEPVVSPLSRVSRDSRGVGLRRKPQPGESKTWRLEDGPMRATRAAGVAPSPTAFVTACHAAMVTLTQGDVSVTKNGLAVGQLRQGPADAGYACLTTASLVIHTGK